MPEHHQQSIHKILVEIEEGKQPLTFFQTPGSIVEQNDTPLIAIGRLIHHLNLQIRKLIGGLLEHLIKEDSISTRTSQPENPLPKLTSLKFSTAISKSF